MYCFDISVDVFDMLDLSYLSCSLSMCNKIKVRYYLLFKNGRGGFWLILALAEQATMLQ